MDLPTQPPALLLVSPPQRHQFAMESEAALDLGLDVGQRGDAFLGLAPAGSGCEDFFQAFQD